jgi:predicted dehydrogenase
MTNIAVIGLGKVGKIRVAAYSRTPGANVVGYFDPHTEWDSNTNSLHHYQSVDEILRSETIDAVHISTPNHETAKLIAASLAAGKHVFAEKPPARNLTEFAVIEKSFAKTSSQVLMFGLNHRHKPSIREIIKVVESGELGDLLWLRCRYGKESSFAPSNQANWRQNPSIAGGGILLDQGIHGLDLILRIMGEPSEVQAMISNSLQDPAGLESNAFVQFRNSNTGVSASLHSTSLQWRYIFSLEVSLTRGSLVLNGLRTPSGSYGDEMLTIHQVNSSTVRDTTEVMFTTDESWSREAQHFLNSVDTLIQPSEGSFSDGQILMRTLERCFETDSLWSRPNLSYGENL